jgi:hypothetical protein
MSERSFIQLKNHGEYEITFDEPWEIRKTKNRKIVKQQLKTSGYYEIHLEQHKDFKLHRIIAEQFIPNPNNYPVIDHLNHNRADNRLENLRWTTSSINNRNRVSHRGVKYEYIDELPADAIPFTNYEMKRGEERKFDKLYLRVENGTPQFLTNDSDLKYRILYANESQSVSHRDINNKPCLIRFGRIQKQMDEARQKAMDIQKVIADTQKTMAETQKIMAETLQRQMMNQQKGSD